MNMLIDKKLIDELLAKAEDCERRRINFDLRTTAEDGSQRMLNALLPGTVVPVHRHPYSNETVFLLSGKLAEVMYEEVEVPAGTAGADGIDGTDGTAVADSLAQTDGNILIFNGRCMRETGRYLLDPSAGDYGCVVPAGVWHTVEVLVPSVLFEAKDGKYGEDGSESL